MGVARRRQYAEGVYGASALGELEGHRMARHKAEARTACHELSEACGEMLDECSGNQNRV